MARVVELTKEGFGYETRGSQAELCGMIVNSQNVVSLNVVKTADGNGGHCFRLGLVFTNSTQMSYNEFAYNTVEEAQGAAVALATALGFEFPPAPKK